MRDLGKRVAFFVCVRRFCFPSKQDAFCDANPSFAFTVLGRRSWVASDAKAHSLWHGANMKMLKVIAALVLAHLLVSCASSPREFHVTREGRPLVVKQEFQFTEIQGLAKVHHTFTVPAGTYPVYATDAGGTYYWAPRYKIPHSMGSLSDPITGGIYRQNGTPATYRIFGKAMTQLTAIISGGVALGPKIPAEFTSRFTE